MRQHKINTKALSEIYADIQQYSPHPTLVNIIAVTKTFNYTAIISAKKNTLPCLGENRVQEFLSKKEEYPEINNNIETHLIGHLQSNKISKCLKLFDNVYNKIAKEIFT